MRPFTSNYTLDRFKTKVVFSYANLQQICLAQLTRGLHAPAAQLLFLQEMESLLKSS